MHLNIVQFSHFEHQFVILPIHIGKTPYIGPRDDTQVKDEVTHRSSISHFEHQFVILPIHIGKTPYIGPRDDTQVKDEVTHRSSMKRLAGRQRQWVKDEVTYRSTITRLAGRQRQWLTIPVHPIMPHMSVISPLKLDMHSTRSSELVCQRNFFVAMFVGLQFAHSVLSCSVHVMCLHDSTHSLSTHSLDNLPPQT
jgi:hypothetical protein